MTGRAIRTLAASLRYNVEQARADLARMQVRTRDQFFHQGYQNGRVAVMESVAESLDLLDDDSAALLLLDLDTWTRVPELVAYARRRGIQTADAVRELVNAGLSHLPPQLADVEHLDADDYPLSAVVALPDPDEVDDDGQVWFGDYDIRVDPTGSGPAEVYVGVNKSAPGLRQLERHAAALLAAIAAARAADAEHLDDNQAATDDRIAKHEEFLASPGADHLFRGE